MQRSVRVGVRRPPRHRPGPRATARTCVHAALDAELGSVLERCVQLEARLGDQPLRDVEIVGPGQPERDVAVIAHEERGLHLEPIGREALQSEDGKGPLTIRPGAEDEVLPHAELHVPVRRDHAAVEKLELGVARRRPFGAALALALHPELVLIAAPPSLKVPPEQVLAVVSAPFELVDPEPMEPQRRIDGERPSGIFGSRVGICAGRRDGEHAGESDREYDGQAAGHTPHDTLTTRNIPMSMW